MFNTALIDRYKTSAMRPRQLWVHLTLVVMSLLLLVIINVVLLVFDEIYRDLSHLFQSLYVQFIAVQGMILWIWTGYNTNLAIRFERLNRSYDFFRLLPLSPHEKVIGILVGKNLVPLLCGGLILILSVCCGLFGEVSIPFMLQFLMLLISIMLLVNLVCLLSSIVQDQSNNSPAASHPVTSVLFAGLLLFMFIPFFIGLLESSRPEEIADFGVFFFIIKMPLMILVSLVVLFFAAWAYTGTVRKFRFENELLFTNTGAVGFMIGYGVVLTGIFSNFTFVDENVHALFWLVMAAPMVLISFATTKSYANYLEYLGQRPLFDGNLSRRIVRLIRCSNLSLGLSLFLIWAVFSLYTTHRFGLGISRTLPLAGAVFSFFVLYWILKELTILFRPRVPRIGLLFGFFIVVHTIVPMILSGILQIDMLFFLSPLGFFRMLFTSLDLNTLSVLGAVSGTNLLLSTLPFIWVFGQYRRLLAVRAAMSNVSE